MCGIAGYFVKQSVRPGPPLTLLLDAVAPRGPDDEGVALIHRARGTMVPCRADRTVPSLSGLPHYLAQPAHEHDVALVCARFAIIDPSPGGHQPFVSGDGSVVAVVNGEIYNFLELRDALGQGGVRCRTASDTEVLVEGYRAWGDGLWERLNGFWAVALYDARDGSVVLARDRLGVAPLYARETEAGLAFASCIRPLREADAARAAPDRDTVAGFIATELKDFDAATCFAGIQSLPAATALRFAPGAWRIGAAHRTTYWRPPARRHAVSDLGLGEAVRRFRETLLSAVELRLRADVPVAGELSGGLDSASIVAATAALGRPVPAYTVISDGARDPGFARAVAAHLSLDAREIAAPEAAFFTDAGWFTAVMEEPYHSPNIHAHYRVRRRIADDGVRVVLSGSGGDEVLAGYFHDFWPQASRAMKRSGQTLQAWLGALVRRARARRAGDNGTAGGGVTPAADGSTRAERLVGSYPSLDFDDQVRYHLAVGLLPYYLRSNDHFTMAIPVEHRLPFLDYRLVDLALALPVSYLFRNGWTKYVLRKAVEPMLPRSVVWRREKEGFPFPVRRFLEAHRAAFAPQLDVVARAGFARHSGADYAALLAGDPQHLWRICSTGLWLSSLR